MKTKADLDLDKLAKLNSKYSFFRVYEFSRPFKQFFSILYMALLPNKLRAIFE